MQLPPPPSRALLAEHASVTTAEVLICLVLGAAFGFVSAIGLVASPTVRALVRPVLVFSQAVPVFALAPMRRRINAAAATSTLRAQAA